MRTTNPAKVGNLEVTGSVTGLDYGLSFECTVSEVVSTVSFKASDLPAKGDHYFDGYFACVVQDAGLAGAAPQGEKRQLSAFVSTTRLCTHPSFSTGLGVGDKILLQHPSLVEKTSTIRYLPGLRDTADLELATKTITATSEASGVGNADYSKALTMTAPGTMSVPDTRLAIAEMGARLDVTIDSFDTATHLYCRVYVDAQDADHKLFDLDWDSTGAKVSSASLNAATKAVIFALLKDGAEHTFYFFFWVNQAVNAVISVVRVRYGVGLTENVAWTVVATLDFDGLISIAIAGDKVGAGTDYVVLLPFGDSIGNDIHRGSVADIMKDPCVVVSDPSVMLYTNTAADLIVVTALTIVMLNQH